ncbi:hypothetical protein [Butyricicoccus pullicaecorum]|uniref:hypothetical protein n=1 Tax=Butyricicoccus pullicaecorum TaxID=501571 RepID=UPI0011CA3305|nr:hypothetical protein [Butyricicoccus pullicaecorum]
MEKMIFGSLLPKNRFWEKSIPKTAFLGKGYPPKITFLGKGYPQKLRFWEKHSPKLRFWEKHPQKQIDFWEFKNV